MSDDAEQESTDTEEVSRQELIELLDAKYSIGNLAKTVYVNQERVEFSQSLSEQDEVLICPPFSGG